MGLEEILSDVDGKTIMRCMSCGICTGSCPSARVKKEFNPRRILHKVYFGEDIDNEIWYCANCYTCQERCPERIKITDIMNLLKRMYLRDKGYLNFIKAVEENLKNFGYTAQLNEFKNKMRERIGLPRLKSSSEIKLILERANENGQA